MHSNFEITQQKKHSKSKITIMGIENQNMAIVTNKDIALAQAISDRSGVSDLTNKVIELYDQPDTTTISIEGRNVLDTADALNTGYFFNKDIGTATTGKIETYDDGNDGKLIQRHIVSDNRGRGMHIKRITFTGINSEGNQDPTVLQRSAFAVQAYTTQGGRPIPSPINISKALRNTQYQSGQVTVELDIWINPISQLTAAVPAGCELTLLIEWGE